MKISELPTYLLRNLEARCAGLNAVLGDHRVVFTAVAEMCLAEIEARVSGKAFPVLPEETAVIFARQINASPPQEFARLLVDLEK